MVSAGVESGAGCGLGGCWAFWEGALGGGLGR